MDLAITRKAMVVGILVFVFTLAWGFFFSTLQLTPTDLLSTAGNLGAANKILTLNFIAFILFFSLAVGTIMVYASKDRKRTAIIISLIPTLIAFAILAFAFKVFMSWILLGVFYAGCIPLVVYTAHVKQQEMRVLPVLRSNFSVSHRWMQILGLGIIVTLAVTALPQQATLYDSFEKSLFSGDIIRSLNVETASADFLIHSQKDTLTKLTESNEYVALAAKQDPEDQQFVSLMQNSLQKVDSPSYRAEVEQEVRNQKNALNTDSVIAQLRDKLPQFKLLKDYYWLIASVLGSILFFAVATLIIQPLSAVAGILMDRFIPGEAEPLPPAQGMPFAPVPEAPAPVPEELQPPMATPEVPKQNGQM
jgi:hypothetical protein